MAPEIETPRGVIEARRALVFVVFAAAMAAASLGLVFRIVEGVGGALLGYALAAGLELLWGERTRPKPSPLWYLLGAAWAIGLVLLGFTGDVANIRFYATLLLGLGVGLCLRHDNGLAPSLILASSVWIAAWQPNLPDRGFDDGEATWVAIATILGIAAATLEHERLMKREGAGTPPVWNVLRLAFLSVWTIVILSLREDVQWGRVFTYFGADLRGEAGQVLLIGILLVGLILAAFAFKPRGETRPRGPGGR